VLFVPAGDWEVLFQQSPLPPSPSWVSPRIRQVFAPRDSPDEAHATQFTSEAGRATTVTVQVPRRSLRK
jgi:hypothetical protein